MVDALLNALHIGSVRSGLHGLTKSKHRQNVNWTQQGSDKAFRGGLLERKVVTSTETGVDGKSNGKRKGCFLIKHGDRLVVPIFLQTEVFFVKSAHGRPVSIGYGHINVDQFDIDFERALWLRWVGRLLAVRENADEQQQNQGNGSGHAVKCLSLARRSLRCVLGWWA